MSLIRDIRAIEPRAWAAVVFAVCIMALAFYALTLI